MDSVAETLAVAAFRFELVKQDPDKMIAFDMESSLRLEGDTGPYLLYSYARASRILGEVRGEGPERSARNRRASSPTRRRSSSAQAALHV